MTVAELYRAISSGKLPSLLFLYGEEAFLLDEALNAAIDALLSKEERDFNLAFVEGKQLDAAELIDMAREFPMFASRRVIVVRQAQEIKAEQMEVLSDYLVNPVVECCLIFCAAKIDKRRKFFQQCKKYGAMVEFKPLYPNKVPAFVRERLRRYNKTISEDALQLFCRRVGNNSGDIISELAKLCSYCGDNPTVQRDDVAAVVSDLRVDSIFDLTDALGARDQSAALLLLERLLDEGQVVQVIFVMITNHFRNLWKISSLLAQHCNEQEIAARARINPYVVSKAVKQVPRFAASSYPAIFTLLNRTDMALKSSSANQRALLQQLVCDIIAVSG